MLKQKPTGPLSPLAVSHGDIVRAHNLLDAIVNGKLPEIQLSTIDRINLYAYRDFACWALGHSTNPTVARVLSELRATIEAQGYQVEDIQSTDRNNHSSPTG